ncbi:hypothetical protein [Methylorubrum thiocyanatum]|uniref:hypothetical protein n=1 Tax=Methylorubrum thiocyanatum TaxID=47958 RepID=UPI00398C50A4
MSAHPALGRRTALDTLRRALLAAFALLLPAILVQGARTDAAGPRDPLSLFAQHSRPPSPDSSGNTSS